MPRRDGTGPVGSGPMTGRGMGCCVGAGAPGLGGMGGAGRGGVRRGMGGGFGWRNRFFATGVPGGVPFGGTAPYAESDPGQEARALKGRSEALQSELELIRKRLAEFEAKGGED